MERQREYQVAQILGRKIEVDTNCHLHIFWDRNGKEVEHVFKDIAPAIRQEKHVIEDYLGFEENIRGYLLVIPGEAQSMDSLVRRTMDIARLFLGPQSLTSKQLQEIQGQLEQLIAEIGRVRNVFKKKFKHQLVQTRIRSAGNLEDLEKAKASQDLYQGGEAGLARLGDIAAKVGGVGIRLQILLREEERVKRVIKSVYFTLHQLLWQLQKDSNQGDLKKIAHQVCTGKNNLINGLESIWIPPYGQRVRSPEVRRLKKLEEYVKTSDKRSMYQALLNAYKKLRPVVKEEEDRRKPKAERWIPR